MLLRSVVTRVVLVSFLVLSACGGSAAQTCPDGATYDGFRCVEHCADDEVMTSSGCQKVQSKPSITTFAGLKGLTTASQRFADAASTGFCYQNGSFSIAISTYSQSQTDALATAGALPVGQGWYLIMNTADGFSWRSTCSSAFELATRSGALKGDGCSSRSGTYKPSSGVNLTLGYIDENGTTTYDCPERGSVTFNGLNDGSVEATVSAKMLGGSEVASFTFRVPGVFEPAQ